MTGRHVDATYAAEHPVTVVTSPSAEFERLRARLGELKPPKKLIGEQVVRNCRSQQADVLDKVVELARSIVDLLPEFGKVDRRASRPEQVLVSSARVELYPTRVAGCQCAFHGRDDRLVGGVVDSADVAAVEVNFPGHESSPSVSGGAPENTSPVLTVGDAADASASSPAGASAALSGGAR